MTRTCPACGNSGIAERRYEQDLEFKGVDLHVTNLVQYVCQSCDYAFETHEQHDANIDTIRSAFVATRSAFKVANNLLTGKTIREVRKMLDLTQHEAAKVFGGGLNAFSKYENEEIVQSFSMDRLIRLVAHLGKPGLEALRLAAFNAPSSMGVLRQADTATSAQVAVLDASRRVLVAVERPSGKPLVFWATRPRFPSNTWAPQPMEWPPLVMHNAVGGASGTRVFDIRTIGAKLAPGSASQVDVETFGANPVTGAWFPLKHGTVKKELANEVST